MICVEVCCLPYGKMEIAFVYCLYESIVWYLDLISIMKLATRTILVTRRNVALPKNILFYYLLIISFNILLFVNDARIALQLVFNNPIHQIAFLWKQNIRLVTQALFFFQSRVVSHINWKIGFVDRELKQVRSHFPRNIYTVQNLE